MTYKVVDQDGNPVTGEELEGCQAKAPAEECTIPVDKSQYPPGTKFEVQVYSLSNNVSSAPTAPEQVNTSEYLTHLKPVSFSLATHRLVKVLTHPV